LIVLYFRHLAVLLLSLCLSCILSSPLPSTPPSSATDDE
jgi:hypothetical protein